MRLPEYRRRRSSRTVMANIVVVENADRRPLQVVILAVAQRPEKGGKPAESEQQRHGDEIDEDVHGERRGCVRASLGNGGVRRAPTVRRRARKALSVTRIEEPDIAAAAINGVT